MRKGYCVVCLCVCQSDFLLLVFSNTTCQGGEITTQTASLQEYLEFKIGDFPKIAELWRVNHEPNDPNLGVFGQEATALARTEIGYARPITAIQSSFHRRHRSIRLFKSLTSC